MHLAGCKDGLVERTIRVIRVADPQGFPWLMSVAPRSASECCAMSDTSALLAADVAPGDFPPTLLSADLYPETATREVLLSRQLQPGDKAWEQDSSRVSCPGCSKLFNWLIRRHHCRCVAALIVIIESRSNLSRDCFFLQILRESDVWRVRFRVGARGQPLQCSLLCGVLQQALQRPVIMSRALTSSVSAK